MDDTSPNMGIIQLLPDYQKKNVKHITIKYEIDGLAFKAQVPLFQNGTAEHVEKNYQARIIKHRCVQRKG